MKNVRFWIKCGFYLIFAYLEYIGISHNISLFKAPWETNVNLKLLKVKNP